jgi:hypothetical protein
MSESGSFRRLIPEEQNGSSGSDSLPEKEKIVFSIKRKRKRISENGKGNPAHPLMTFFGKLTHDLMSNHPNKKKPPTP